MKLVAALSVTRCGEDRVLPVRLANEHALARRVRHGSHLLENFMDFRLIAVVDVPLEEIRVGPERNRIGAQLCVL